VGMGGARGNDEELTLPISNGAVPTMRKASSRVRLADAILMDDRVAASLPAGTSPTSADSAWLANNPSPIVPAATPSGGSRRRRSRRRSRHRDRESDAPSSATVRERSRSVAAGAVEEEANVPPVKKGKKKRAAKACA
jgi:hypothetical protein